MRDFHQFLQDQNEGLSNLFGLLGPKRWQPPQPIEREFQAYWKQLVMKHQGNYPEAWKEFQELKSTQAGKYMMMRMNARMDPRIDTDANDATVGPQALTHPVTPTTNHDNLSNSDKARQRLLRPDGKLRTNDQY